MRHLARRIVHLALDSVPFAVSRMLIGPSPVVACYHTVSDSTLAHVRHLFAYKTPAQFEADLLQLKKHFRFVSYEDLVSGDRTRVTAGSMLMTFDDGYAECFTVVRPILKAHGIPCIFFVTTNFIDNAAVFYRNRVALCIDRLRTLDSSAWERSAPALQQAARASFPSSQALVEWLKASDPGHEQTCEAFCTILGIDQHLFLRMEPYLSLEQLRRLVKDGFTIGAHGKSHTHLSRLSGAALIDEIVGSCTTVKAWTGQTHVPFAFPFSAGGVDRDVLSQVLLEHPFITHLFGSDGVRRDRPFILNRVLLDDPAAAPNAIRTLRAAYKTYTIERLARRSH